jgi:hypothetical protein
MFAKRYNREHAFSRREAQKSLAEEVGFEPTGPLRAHALSRRADSAALALLRREILRVAPARAVRSAIRRGGEGGI